MTRRNIKLTRSIKEVLTASDFVVQDLPTVPPMLMIGAHQHNVLLLVKPAGSRLTPAEGRWLTRWRGQAEVVTSPYQAVQTVNQFFRDSTLSPKLTTRPVLRGGDAARKSQ